MRLNLHLNDTAHLPWSKFTLKKLIEKNKNPLIRKSHCHYETKEVQ